MLKLVIALKESSLSIVLFALFALCLAGQSLAGWRLENSTMVTHGRTTLDYWHYVASPTNIEALASNWQAAILQLASLILLGGFLYQRGAPHSRDPRHARPRRKRSRPHWAYRNSLFLTFLLLFAVTLVIHAWAGQHAEDALRVLAREPPVSIGAFLLSAKFWSVTLETWQAEYLVIALYLVLSVFLRQEDSPESKPVEARDKTTGKANK
jgi:Domain of unknown function (DUF6766)